MSLTIIRPIDLEPYNSETDLTPPAEIVTIYDHASWTKPKRSYANMVNTFFDWAEASFATILTLLGISEVKWNEMTAFNPATKVDAVEGSTLITEAELTRLSAVIPPVIIDLPAGATVTDRLLTATLPDGWTFTAVGDTGANLQIVHTLTGRSIAHVNVKVIDPITDNRMLTPYRDAYSGINESGETLTIEGIAPNNNLPLILILIFY